MLDQISWQPTASINNLLARAKIIREIRHFFAERGVLEVETPILSEFGVTDVNLSTFCTEFVAPFAEQSKTLWLNTSPEYHMKRLLAAGSGPIFQLGKGLEMRKRDDIITLNLLCLNGIDLILICIV